LDKVTSFAESRYVQPGEAIVTIEMFGVIMGLSICYDLRFPELYRSLTFLGAKVLFVPAAFTVPTGKDHWEILLRARAIENQCFVVAPAQVGNHNEERTSYGHTMIIDPWGYIMAQCPDQPGIIVCDLDFERQKTIRRKLPCLTHIRPEVYSRMKT
jgi:predicted amidohydrolase